MNLVKVQRIAKFFKVLEVIALVCVIIALVACIAGTVILIAFPNAIKVKDTGLADYIIAEINKNAGSNPIDLKTLQANVTGATIAVIVSFVLVLTKLKYLNFELSEGTPFTEEGASKLRKIGILEIILSVVSGVAIIAVGILFGVKADYMQISTGTSIISAIGILFFARLLSYGAELRK